MCMKHVFENIIERTNLLSLAYNLFVTGDMKVLQIVNGFQQNGNNYIRKKTGGMVFMLHLPFQNSALSKIFE
jgi:hypothetical protein